MNASAVYNRFRISNTLHEANAARCQSLLQRSADVFEQCRESLPPRFSNVMKLAAYTSVANAGATTGNPNVDTLTSTLLGSLLADSVVPHSRIPLKLVSNRLPVTSTVFGGVYVASLLVGSGATVTATDPFLAVASKHVSALGRYGVLGLFEKFLTDSAESLEAKGKHRGATACYIAATAYAFPLEVVRVSLFALTLLAQVPLTLLCMTAKLVFCAAMFSLNRHEDPAFYVPGLQSLTSVLVTERGYSRWFTSKTDAILSNLLARMWASSVKFKLEKLSPIFQVEDTKAISECLERYVANQDPEIDWKKALDCFDYILDSFRKKLLDEKTFFTALREYKVYPFWQHEQFRRVALRLHPDKRATWAKNLSPDAQTLCKGLYAFTYEIAKYYQNRRWKEPTPNKGPSLALHPSQGQMIVAG